MANLNPRAVPLTNEGAPADSGWRPRSVAMEVESVADIVADIEPIATPATADAEDVANKLNELIAALQG